MYREGQWQRRSSTHWLAPHPTPGIPVSPNHPRPKCSRHQRQYSMTVYDVCHLGTSRCQSPPPTSCDTHRTRLSGDRRCKATGQRGDREDANHVQTVGGTKGKINRDYLASSYGVFVFPHFPPYPRAVRAVAPRSGAFGQNWGGCGVRSPYFWGAAGLFFWIRVTEHFYFSFTRSGPQLPTSARWKHSQPNKRTRRELVASDRRQPAF